MAERRWAKSRFRNSFADNVLRLGWVQGWGAQMGVGVGGLVHQLLACLGFGSCLRFSSLGCGGRVLVKSQVLQFRRSLIKREVAHTFRSFNAAGTGGSLPLTLTRGKLLDCR